MPQLFIITKAPEAPRAPESNDFSAALEDMVSSIHQAAAAARDVEDLVIAARVYLEGSFASGPSARAAQKRIARAYPDVQLLREEVLTLWLAQLLPGAVNGHVDFAEILVGVDGPVFASVHDAGVSLDAEELFALRIVAESLGLHLEAHRGPFTLFADHTADLNLAALVDDLYAAVTPDEDVTAAMQEDAQDPLAAVATLAGEELLGFDSDVAALVGALEATLPNRAGVRRGQGLVALYVDALIEAIAEEAFPGQHVEMLIETSVRDGVVVLEGLHGVNPETSLILPGSFAVDPDRWDTLEALLSAIDAFSVPFSDIWVPLDLDAEYLNELAAAGGRVEALLQAPGCCAA